MKWVTREKVKVDRVACPWLIRKLPSVRRLRAALPSRAPIEHVRAWAVSHRPKY
jgi:Chromate resistance exported protein